MLLLSKGAAATGKFAMDGTKTRTAAAETAWFSIKSKFSGCDELCADMWQVLYK